MLNISKQEAKFSLKAIEIKPNLNLALQIVFFKLSIILSHSAINNRASAIQNSCEHAQYSKLCPKPNTRKFRTWNLCPLPI